MRISILGAMDLELSYIRDYFMIKKDQLSKYEIRIVSTGVGKVNAAVEATNEISTFNSDLIVNVGVVGALRKYNKFDVVVPNRFVYHDVDCTAVGQPICQMYGCSKYIELNEKNDYIDLLMSMVDENQKCTIATGDSFVSKLRHRAQIKINTDADVVDMESTAIAQACHRFGKPFICIKTVSDKCDSKSYEFFRMISKASRLYTDLLVKYINELDSRF